MARHGSPSPDLDRPVPGQSYAWFPSSHILNGDCLLEQFPLDLEGERIVVRECLVEGEVLADSIEAFFELRARIIRGFGGVTSDQDYVAKSVSEFNRILTIPPGSTIYLWFEDDLFCQVHLWFVAHLLHHHVRASDVRLVRPPVLTHLGFAGLDSDGLQHAFHQAVQLQQIPMIARLWPAYQHDRTEDLLDIATLLKPVHPYIHSAVLAHLDRRPSGHDPGRPIRLLHQIRREHPARSADDIVREFARREPIYGFTTDHVLRLLASMEPLHDGL